MQRNTVLDDLYLGINSNASSLRRHVWKIIFSKLGNLYHSYRHLSIVSWPSASLNTWRLFVRKLGIGRALALGLSLGVVFAGSSMGCSAESTDLDADQSEAAVCVGGPKFDPAGDKNVGNGVGRQFIGGQCLGAKDCASGCCALPCGICSGPGAQFQAGKQGCGFEARGGARNQQPAQAAPANNGGQCVGGPAFDPA